MQMQNWSGVQNELPPPVPHPRPPWTPARLLPPSRAASVHKESLSIYQEICESLSGRGITIAVDATKELLLKVLPFAPFLIKPKNPSAVFSTPRFFNTMDTLIPFPPGSSISSSVRLVSPIWKSFTDTDVYGRLKKHEFHVRRNKKVLADTRGKQRYIRIWKMKSKCMLDIFPTRQNLLIGSKNKTSLFKEWAYSISFRVEDMEHDILCAIKESV